MLHETLNIYTVSEWRDITRISRSIYDETGWGRWQQVNNLATLTIDRSVAAGIWFRHNLQLTGQ